VVALRRRFAALRACFESAFFETTLRGSFFKAFKVARERLVDLVFFPALRRSRLACSRVSFEAFSGAGNSTP